VAACSNRDWSWLVSQVKYKCVKVHICLGYGASRAQRGFLGVAGLLVKKSPSNTRHCTSTLLHCNRMYGWCLCCQAPQLVGMVLMGFRGLIPGGLMGTIGWLSS
jgi:hypothetical protein